MADFPTGTVDTTDVDEASDDPSLARADFLTAMQKLNDILSCYGLALGIAPLDSNGLLPLDKLPSLLTGKTATPTAHTHITADITDFPSFAPTFDGALVTLINSYDVTNIQGSYFTTLYDTVISDPSGIWNPGYPRRLTVPAGVSKVKITAYGTFRTMAQGWGGIFLAKNGFLFHSPDVRAVKIFISPGDSITLMSPVLSVSPGDFFEIWWSFDIAGYVITVTGFQYQWFEMQIVERS